MSQDPSNESAEVPAATSRQRRDMAWWIVMAVAVVGMVTMWWMIRDRTGEVSYTVDDCYIHATLAKILAAHGSFGIVPGEFAAASSSLNWTLLLAVVFFFAGPAAWVPGLLATIFGFLTLERADRWMRETGANRWMRLVVGLMILAYAPLLPIASTGMEHTFHAWSLTGLLLCLLRTSRNPGASLVPLFFWALVAGGARYESLFFLPILLPWLAAGGRWKTAVTLAAGMVLPAAIFAVYSMAHGGYPLPNSLMLKGNIDKAFEIRAFRVALENQHIFVLLVLLAVSMAAKWFRPGPDGRATLWISIAVTVTLLIHLQLAQLGWFYRDEGYLIVLALVEASSLGAALAALGKGRHFLVPMTACIVLAFATLPLFWRSSRATSEIVHAAGNIRDQQLQMARVTRLLGPGARVAVNDLGAVSFFSEARVLDLYGLGDNALARAKRNRTYGADRLQSRLEETATDFVICYPSWFTPPDNLPETLIPVESWDLADNLICGSERVVFYATDRASEIRLRRALDTYRKSFLPVPESTNQMTPLSDPTVTP
ncbi:MAG: hypothetical protein KDN05_11015 [Verrucomicrobiae bacterium]|nr:hypothetical protein [Verrucomicrobiae bacterium]